MELISAERSDAQKERVKVLMIRGEPVRKRTDVEPDPESGVTRQRVFETLIADGRIIAPPFDPLWMSTLVEHSSEMGQVIEAVEVNVVGHGQRLVRRRDVDVNDKTARREYLEIEEFLTYGNYDDESLTSCRRHQRRDYETVGCSFLEMILDTNGGIVGFRHIPSHKIRLGLTDKEFTPYGQPRWVDGRIKTITKRKRFRRFVQVDSDGHMTWFKEFGDPRNIDCQTGEVIQDADLKTMRKQGRVTNSMLYRRIYSPRTPYGIPRWIGNLLAIAGARAAEEINYTTFMNNNVPSMFIIVSNGVLTQESVDRLTEFASEVTSGDGNRARFVVLEAEMDKLIPSQGTGQHPKIEIKSVRDVQHDDAMFQKYEGNNADKIRRSWRLPKLVVGNSDDYNRATSDNSLRVTEEQVFEPERREEDWTWNRILRYRGTRYHLFRTNSPNITSHEDLIRVTSAAERSGGMTPRIMRDVVEEIMGREIPSVDEERVELDAPFSLQMAEAVKNMAKPNEVGQQVTALKGVEGAEVPTLLSGVSFQTLVVGEELAAALVDGAVSFVKRQVEAPADIPLAVVAGGSLYGFVHLGVAKADGDVVRQDVLSFAATPVLPVVVDGGSVRIA